MYACVHPVECICRKMHQHTFYHCCWHVVQVVSAGEGDLPTLMDMVLAARRLTNSSEFRKLLLCFVTISNRCSAKKNVACYSEKMQKLKTELKV